VSNPDCAATRYGYLRGLGLFEVQPKTASIWHNNGNNNNLKGAERLVIAR
jgi:hypothetical protein